MSILQKAEKEVNKYTPEDNQTICKHTSPNLIKAQQKVVRIRAIMYGSLSFAIGMLVYLIVFEPLSIWLNIRSKLPFGIYAVASSIFSLTIVGVAIRFWVLNRQCLNQIVDDKSKTSSGWSKGIIGKPPCSMKKADSDGKISNGCQRMTNVVKSSCSIDTNFLVLIVVVGIIGLISVTGLVASFFIPEAWIP